MSPICIFTSYTLVLQNAYHTSRITNLNQIYTTFIALIPYYKTNSFGFFFSDINGANNSVVLSTGKILFPTFIIFAFFSTDKGYLFVTI